MPKALEMLHLAPALLLAAATPSLAVPGDGTPTPQTDAFDAGMEIGGPDTRLWLKGMDQPVVGRPFSARVTCGPEGVHACLLVSLAETPVPLLDTTWYVGSPFVTEVFTFDGASNSPDLMSTDAAPGALLGATLVAQAAYVNSGSARISNPLRIRFGVEPPSGPPFLYINNHPHGSAETPNSVSAYEIGPDGSLANVPGSPFATGGSSSSGTFHMTSLLVATPDRRFLYAGNPGSKDISGFAVQPNGSLNPTPGSPYALPTTGLLSSMDVADEYLFVGTGFVGEAPWITTLRVAADGSLSEVASREVAPSQVGIGELAVDPVHGRLFAVAHPALHSFDIEPSGALTRNGPEAGMVINIADPRSLACNPDGSRLYVGGGNAFVFPQIATVFVDGDGTLTRSGDIFLDEGVGGVDDIAVSADGRRVWTTASAGGPFPAFATWSDTSGCALTDVPNAGGMLDVVGLADRCMALTSDESLLYVTKGATPTSAPPGSAPPAIWGFRVQSDGSLAEAFELLLHDEAGMSRPIGIVALR